MIDKIIQFNIKFYLSAYYMQDNSIRLVLGITSK